jgi:hypothetical protein
MSPKVLSLGVPNPPKVGENPDGWSSVGWSCEVERVYDVNGVRIAAGEPPGKGECKFSSRSASETRTGSGVGMLAKGGGGIDAELNGEKLDGEGNGCCCSNLRAGSDIKEAMEGWVLADGFGGAAFVLRASPVSDVYITATLVEGEFIVPVNDHPMAMTR